MNRKPKFLIVLAVAAITFGGLMKTIGPRHFNHHGCCQEKNDCKKETITNNRTSSADEIKNPVLESNKK